MAVLDASDKAEIVARVELLIGRTDKHTLIEQLVDDAAEQVLLYTHRQSIPYELYKSVGDLAIVTWNRLGTQGDIKRSEGGESYEFDAMPKEIYSVMQRFRLARVDGHAFEAE